MMEQVTSFMSSSDMTATEAKYMGPATWVRDMRMVSTRQVFCTVRTSRESSLGSSIAENIL